MMPPNELDILSNSEQNFAVSGIEAVREAETYVEPIKDIISRVGLSPAK